MYVPKQIIEIKHNIAKNPNWPEANQLFSPEPQQPITNTKVCNHYTLCVFPYTHWCVFLNREIEQ